jgi:hypothetical protein
VAGHGWSARPFSGGTLMSSKKITVVFYGYCGKRSRFASQYCAEKAAAEYGREHGYTLEAYQCERAECKCCFHIRARTWWPSPVVPTGDAGRQFESSSLSAEQLDAALSRDRNLTLRYAEHLLAELERSETE